MSIQFLNPNAFLTRITNLVQGSAPSYSWCVWFRPDQDVTIDYQTIIALEGATEWQGVYSNSIANDYSLSVNNGGGSNDTPTKTLVAGKWYPISYHKSGTSHQYYVSIGLVGGVTVDMSAVTFTGLFLGSDGAGSNHGTFKGFREWTAVLSTTEFQAEFNSQTPVRTSGLVTNTPLVNNLLDTTSNHNDWTTTGVVNVDYQFISDDPIPAGAVVTDATDLGTLPYSAVISAQPTDVEFVFNQWFKYTAVVGETYIGGWFFGALTLYRAQYSIFSDAGVTDYPPNNPINGSQTINRRFQMPVVAGHTYYFKVFPVVFSTALDSGVDLTVDFETGPNKTVPNGSPFINDDLQDFFAGVVSSIDADDYNVLKFIDFVPTTAENGGDISQQNGKILIIDDITAKILLFSPQLTELLDTGIVGATNGVIRRLADGSAFYTSHALTVNRVSKDGVVGGTTWTLTGTRVTALAPSNDELILYTSVTNATNAPVKRWDLVNSVYLSDLVAGITGYFVSDIMVLDDDTILVLYFKSSTTPNSKVLHYATDGSLLDTYDLGNPVATPPSSGSITFDFTDPANYFLARVHNLVFDGSSTLIRVKISDGTTTRVKHVVFENGIYQAAETATPLTKFGISHSCPFFPIRALVQNGGIYKLVPGKRNDTLWLDITEQTTEDVKIPDPFIETAAIGN